eukprot:6653325-Prymnesium_polylepis.1
MEALYGLIGYGGEGAGSFAGTWRNVESRTKKLLKIPDTNSKRMGLLIRHVMASLKAFQKFGDNIKTMHANVISIAIKPTR